MALFLTPIVNGLPKFSGKPGAHWWVSPDGTQAILEFFGTIDDYAEAKGDPDTTELTRGRARAIGRQWDRDMGPEA